VKRSTIGWTDFSGGDLNFVTGCTAVSEGCEHCYARRLYQRFGLSFEVRYHPEKLDRLLTRRWPTDGNKRGPGTAPMLFVCDTGDLFHAGVADGTIVQALAVMFTRKDVVWQVLTKRPVRMRDALAHLWTLAPLESIWLGTSVESQQWVDRRVAPLIETPAAMRWVSVEPMLGPIDLAKWLPGLDWVVCGGESGPGRRPFDPMWAVRLFEQCLKAGVRFFYKQGSGYRPGEDDELPAYGFEKSWPGGVSTGARVHALAKQ